MHKLLKVTGVSILIVGVAIPALITVDAQKFGYVQTDCPTIVKQAIDTVSAQCGKTVRGKLCYGNSTITTQFQPGVKTSDLKFQAPGDTVDVSTIKQFTLSGMSTADNSWGVAEMKIKADLPDANPTQAVTMILFGDVRVTDTSADPPPATATLTATPLISLLGDPTMTPTGPKKTATPTASTSNKYGGLQAFYFQSSDTAPCDQAPHDGILLQSPQGNKQRVTLVIDGATISLGSTVYVTAQPNKFLTISTLEGSAFVTSGGQTQSVNAGQSMQVPLDASLRASGVPNGLELYNTDTVRGLPTRVLPTHTLPFITGLPSDITFATWTEVQTVTSGNCKINNGLTTYTSSSRIAYNDSTMWYDALVLTKTAQGVYMGTNTSPTTSNGVYDGGWATKNLAMVVTSPTKITGTNTENWKDGSICTYSLTVTLGQSP